MGVVSSSELNSCSPSLRVRWKTKGLAWPAAADSVPALITGLKGRAAGVGAQALPPGPALIAKLEEGFASGVPGELQGTRSVVVVKVPQVVGVASGARGPDLKLTSSRLEGSCGFSVKVAVSWPVLLFAVMMPGSLKLTP